MKKQNYLTLIIIILISSCQKEDSIFELKNIEEKDTSLYSKNSSLINFGCEESNYKYDFKNPTFTVGERGDLLWGINGHSLRHSSAEYDNPYNAIDIQETINLLKKLGTQIYRNDIHVDTTGSLTHNEDENQLDLLIDSLTEEGIEFLPMIYTSGYKNHLEDNSPFQYSSIKNLIETLSNRDVQNIVSSTEIWTENYNIGYNTGKSFVTNQIGRGNQINYYNVGNENASRMIKELNDEEGYEDCIGFGNDIYDFFSCELRAKHIVGSTAFIKGAIEGIKEIKSDAVCFTTETAALFGYIDFFNIMNVGYDAIGWNWYSGFGKITEVKEGNEDVGLNPGLNVYNTLNSLTNNKPIWLTEINKTNGSSGSQGFDRQADVLRDLMSDMYELPNIKAFLVYELLDGSSGNPSSTEDYFGLVKNPLSGNFNVKPAFNTYRYSIEEFDYGYHDFMFSYYTLYRGDNRDIQNDSGIHYWANKFKEGFEISRFLELYMEVDARNFIDSNYKLLLGRNPDPLGENYYLSKLQNGLTREWVMADIISSDSFLNQANNANYNGHSSNENFIYHVYSKLLGRTPTNEEMSEDYFTDSTRNSRRNYALSFLNSSKYIEKFITDQYGIYFSRTPDDNGLQYHASKWIDQKDFLIKIMISNEFWRKSVIRGNCERQQY